MRLGWQDSKGGPMTEEASRYIIRRLFEYAGRDRLQRLKLEASRKFGLEGLLKNSDILSHATVSETEALRERLRQIVSDFGIGILLVEHDLKTVMQLCDRVYVLNKGQLIAEGVPKDVAKNADVVEAYVGEEPLEEPQ